MNRFLKYTMGGVLILLLLLFLLNQPAFSAPDSVTTKELVDRAIEKNLAIDALKLESHALRAKTSQAKRWEDPGLELGAERKNDSLGDTDFAKIGLSQFVPRPGRQSAKEAMAAYAERANEVDRQNTELEVRNRVLQLIYFYRAASEKAAHAKERYDRIRTVATYLRSRPFASPQKRAEAAIVRSKLMVLEKDLRKLEADHRAAWHSLNLYVGLERGAKIATPWYKAAPKLALPELLQKAEAANPEVKRQTLRAQAQEGELRLARTEAWPGLTLSMNFTSGSGASPEKTYGLGVAFPLPVFNGNRGNIQSAESSKLAEEARLKWARERAASSLISAFERYSVAAASMLDLSPDKIGALEREMTDIDSSFKRGQVDLITFLEADAQHFESLNSILDAQTEFLSALGDLLLLIGEAPQPLEN